MIRAIVAATRIGLFAFLPLAPIGCSIFTDPADYDLPRRDTSLDPDALVAPRSLYLCGEWPDGMPNEEHIFVDVAFDRRTEADPADRPTSRHLDVLEKHRGEVAYKFKFPVVRAWIATRNVPALEQETAVIGVFRVANLARYDWPVSVGYRRPFTSTDGTVRFGELGGRVGSIQSVSNSLSGLLPDKSAAVLRQDRNVEYIEGDPGHAKCDITPAGQQVQLPMWPVNRPGLKQSLNR
jgi:hypothetical protein